MKKFLSALLALVMVFSLTAVAFAADNNDDAADVDDAANGPSVTGDVAPVVEEVTLVIDGVEFTLTKEQIAANILITSHEEGEAAMNKLKEELKGKGLTEEEIMKYSCENGLTYAENLTLLNLYHVAAASDTTCDYIRAHGEGVLEAAMEALGMTEEEINEYVIAMIFDVRVVVENLAKALNIDVTKIETMTVKFGTVYVNADFEVFLQRDYVAVDDYPDLVTDDQTVNIEKSNVVFFPGIAGEDEEGGFVITDIDPNKNGPITLYVKQPAVVEEAK